jgi:hypothetical protein
VKEGRQTGCWVESLPPGSESPAAPATDCGRAPKQTGQQRSFYSGRSYGHCTGAANPPSPIVSGAVPTSRGIRPVMGPPLVEEAGVTSV